jgi:hypothetical protein
MLLPRYNLSILPIPYLPSQISLNPYHHKSVHLLYAIRLEVFNLTCHPNYFLLLLLQIICQMTKIPSTSTVPLCARHGEPLYHDHTCG